MEDAVKLASCWEEIPASIVLQLLTLMLFKVTDKNDHLLKAWGNFVWKHYYR